MKNELEKDIQKKCNDVLRKLGIKFYHDEAGHAGRNRKAHRASKPDLIFFHKGKTFAFEVKRTGGKLRPDQFDELQRLVVDGGVIAHWGDLSEFMIFLNEWVLK